MKLSVYEGGKTTPLLTGQEKITCAEYVRDFAGALYCIKGSKKIFFAGLDGFLDEWGQFDFEPENIHYSKELQNLYVKTVDQKMMCVQISSQSFFSLTGRAWDRQIKSLRRTVSHGGVDEFVFDTSNGISWIALGAQNRVVSNTESSLKTMIGNGEPENSIASNPKEMCLNLPAGLTINAKNKILYVSDFNNSRILAFDISKKEKPKLVKVYGRYGGKKRLETDVFCPSKIQYGYGNLFVVNQDGSQVLSINLDTEYSHEIYRSDTRIEDLSLINKKNFVLLER